MDNASHDKWLFSSQRVKVQQLLNKIFNVKSFQRLELCSKLLFELSGSLLVKFVIILVKWSS